MALELILKSALPELALQNFQKISHFRSSLYLAKLPALPYKMHHINPTKQIPNYFFRIRRLRLNYPQIRFKIHLVSFDCKNVTCDFAAHEDFETDTDNDEEKKIFLMNFFLLFLPNMCSLLLLLHYLCPNFHKARNS